MAFFRKHSTLAALCACICSVAASEVKAQQPAPPVPLLRLSVLKQLLGGSLFKIAHPLVPQHLLIPRSEGNQLRMLAQQILMRSNGADSINYQAYQNAILQKMKMPAGPMHLQFQPLGAPPGGGGGAGFGPPPGGIFNNTLLSLGPQNFATNNIFGTGPGAFGAGPTNVSGRINGIAADPLTTGTMYIASAGGGAWKTTDGGINWQPLSDQWPALNTASVAVDPTNHDVYVGTGDIVYGTLPFGLMKSTDGGATWTNQGSGVFSHNTVNKILVDPVNHNNILVATGLPFFGGVYRSTDGGSTWTEVISTRGTYQDVEASPLVSGSYPLLWAAGNFGGGVWKSADDGVTWTAVAPPASNPFGSSAGGISVAPSAVNPKGVYVFDGDHHKIWYSGDAGSTWIDVTGNLGSMTDGTGSSIWNQQWYDFYVKCFSYNGKDALAVGLKDIFVAYNLTYFPTFAAPQWISALHTYSGNDIAHTDQHDLIPVPGQSNQFLIGNDGGIYAITLTPTSIAATSLNSSLDITQFYHIDINAAQDGWVMGGSQDNGTGSTNVGGNASQTNPSAWQMVLGGDGNGCAIDAQNPATQFASAEYNFVGMTTNYWNTRTLIRPLIGGGEFQPFVTPLQRDPEQGGVVYTATNYLYRYDASLGSWQVDLGGQKLSNNPLEAIAVAPSNSSVLYTGGTDGKLYMSANSGQTWREIDQGKFTTVNSISVLSYNPYNILVAGSGSLGSAALCTNTQAATPAWQALKGSGSNVLPGISGLAIARNPYDPSNVFYMGTDLGAYYTVDGGQNWYNLNTGSGLPNAEADEMHADRGTGSNNGHGLLTISTFGRGAWQADLVNLLSLSSLSPAAADLNGGAFTLTVNGAHFNPGDQVQWNGGALSTTYVSSTALTASVPAADVTQAGQANISVFDPNVVNTSNTLTLPIALPQISLRPLSIQKNPSTITVYAFVLANVAPVHGLTPVSATLGGVKATSITLNTSSLNIGGSTRITFTFPASISAGLKQMRVSINFAGGSFSGGVFVLVP